MVEQLRVLCEIDTSQRTIENPFGCIATNPSDLNVAVGVSTALGQ